MTSPLPIVCFLDGRPGHEAQVRGLVAACPGEVDVHEVRLPAEVPGGERQLAVWALAVKHLSSKPPVGLLEELLGEEYATLVAHRPKLLIAAGSRAGLYSYCLGRMLWVPTVQAMTHGLLKTVFSLNIIPRHDKPAPASNIVVVDTAPNPYLPEVADAAAADFLARQQLPADQPYWSVLLGGPVAGAPDDAMRPGPLVGELTALLDRASREGVRVLLSTSRRTPAAVADALAPLQAGFPALAYLQDFRTDPARTAGALLGAGRQVFLTPDSISMVSEALWAGRGVTLLPLDRDATGTPIGPTGKHARFLAPLLASGQVRWFGADWTPPEVPQVEGYRHPDFLAIQAAVSKLLAQTP